MVETRCGLCCSACEWKETTGCGGCIETNGHPFHGECPVALCCQQKGLLHCGECPEMPCALLTQYSCDPEHGDTPPGKRIDQCRKWAYERKNVQTKVSIVKAFRETYPESVFIGKCYTDADRVDGSFGKYWGEWHANGWFELLEALGAKSVMGGTYLGLMSCDPSGQSFEYRIGMLLQAGTQPPEGFAAIELPEMDAGICWIQGAEDDPALYGQHEMCVQRFQMEGLWPPRMVHNRQWFFESYRCPQFTETDEQGRVILEYGVIIGKENENG